MIKGDIAEAGYAKCDPSCGDSEPECSLRTLETTCVVYSLAESLTEQPQEGAESQQSGLREEFNVHVVGMRYVANLSPGFFFLFSKTFPQSPTPVAHA